MRRLGTTFPIYSSSIPLGDDMKESRLHNKPVNEDIAQLKTTELHLNSEIMKLKSDLRILTEISNNLSLIV